MCLETIALAVDVGTLSLLDYVRSFVSR